MFHLPRTAPQNTNRASYPCGWCTPRALVSCEVSQAIASPGCARWPALAHISGGAAAGRHMSVCAPCPAQTFIQVGRMPAFGGAVHVCAPCLRSEGAVKSAASAGSAVALRINAMDQGQSCGWTRARYPPGAEKVQLRPLYHEVSSRLHAVYHNTHLEPGFY